MILFELFWFKFLAIVYNFSLNNSLQETDIREWECSE